MTGAAVVPTELIARMRSELGFEEVITAYGLTECGGFATGCRPGDSDEVISLTSGRAARMASRCGSMPSPVSRGRCWSAGST